MKHKFLQLLILGTMLLLLAGLGLTALASPALPSGQKESRAPAYTYNTVITVTSGTDPDTSKSTICTGNPVCTLRRAIVESRLLPSGDLPVLIKFNIPTSDTSYDNNLKVWKIEPQASSDNSVFRRIKGQVIIDGDTQPNGRTDGPKIIIRGPSTAKDGLIVGDVAGDDMIIIRNLAFQNFKTHLYINTGDNTVENCWFGLSDNGETLSSGSDTTPEGGSALDLTSGSSGNTIRNNIFAGFTGVAAAIRGNDNQFVDNWVGTRADGTVPIPSQFNQHPCLPGAWTGGGGGITVESHDHQILNNRFAGLFLDVGPGSTQSPAMRVTGSGHTINGNVIGLDANDDLVGVCGRGLDFGGGPSAMNVWNNTLVETGLSAILMNHWTFNGNTLRSNIIKRADAWPGEQGNDLFPEDAISYGPHVPDALRNFKPAQVTTVNNTAVSGTSGTGSPCPGCTVELFLDDADAVTETLQSLAVVTANGSGNWTATLPAPLETGQGLRTMSTVPDNFTITGLDAGTTSNLSPLQAVLYRIFLPLVLK